MPIYETFSKRQQRLTNQNAPIIYQYEELFPPFRQQVIYIWHSALGSGDGNENYAQPAVTDYYKLWGTIHDTIARERGLETLQQRVGRADDIEKCEQFIKYATTDDVLDIIEWSFYVLDTQMRSPRPPGRQHIRVSQDPDDAIAELNHRFREHGIGYQYLGGLLIRVDSQYIHNQIVEPALALLHEQGFQGPEDEFLRAHEHYRAGKNKEAIVEALKAFESTMKAIYDERQWAYSPTDTAKKLIDVLFSECLVPSYIQSHFTSLRTTLEAGLPTVRNKTSGHGQGSNTVIIPEYLAAYALHLAATNIVLLVQAHKTLK